MTETETVDHCAVIGRDDDKKNAVAVEVHIGLRLPDRVAVRTILTVFTYDY